MPKKVAGTADEGGLSPPPDSAAARMATELNNNIPAPI
jgi:hypothetical protein